MTYCMVVGEADNYRDIACLLGKGMGYDVAVFSDDATAINVAVDRKPDIIIFNWRIVSDYTLAYYKAFMWQSIDAKPHVIQCIYSITDEQKSAMQAVYPVDLFIQKPYSPRLLAEILGTLSTVSHSQRVPSVLS